MRRALLIAWLFFLVLLSVGVVWVLTSESALQWVVAQAQKRVAGELAFGEISGRLAGPIEIRELTYRSDTTDVRVERATLDWRPGALLYGRLYVTHARIAGVTIDLPQASEDEPRTAWELPLKIRVDDAELQQLQIRRGGDELLSIDSARIALTAGGDDLGVSELRVSASRFSLEANGALDDDDGIRIEWRFQPPDRPAVVGRGTFSGTLKQLRTHQQISKPFAATVDADIDLRQADPRFVARVALPPTRLRDIDKTWPDIGVSGRIEAKGTPDALSAVAHLIVDYEKERFVIDAQATRAGDTIALSELETRRPDDSGRLQARGRVTLGTPPRVDLNVSWRDWRWPGLAGLGVKSQGEAGIEGTFSDFRATAQAAFFGDGTPSAKLDIAVHGDVAGIAIETATLRALDGVITVQGAVERDPWRWQLTVRGESLNPGSHWPAWPGELALSARVRGNAGKGALRNEVALADVSGNLRGHRVRAGGRWMMNNNRHDINDALVRVGDTVLRARGNVGKAWDVTAEIDVPGLGTLVPDGRGRLRANATVAGPRAAPQIDASLKGTDIGLEAFDVAQFEATAVLDFANRGPSRIDAAARKLRYGARLIENIRLTGRGPLDQHTVSLQLNASQTMLNLSLDGGYADRAWTGHLAETSITSEFGTWHLQEPAPVRVGAVGIAAGPLCLAARDAGRVCTDVDWSPTGPGRATLQASALPLAWFNPFLPASLTLAGTMETSAQASFERGRPVRANAQWSTTSAAISRHGSDPLVAKRADGRLRLDDNGLRADLALVLADGGDLAADIALPRFSPRNAAGTEQPVTGRLRIELDTLARLGLFLPDVENPRGKFNADFRLGGTLAQLTLAGEATVTDAAATLPALGIRVRTAQLRARARGGRTLQLDGRLASGSGDINVDGTITFDAAAAWRIDAQVAGKRFHVIDTSQASVLASPDLKIAARPGWIRVEGGVHIPEAKLTPKKPETPIAPSDDVVIVNAPEARIDEKSGWAVETQVRVTLGDKVAFDGFGLTGNITGGLVAIDGPERITTARGELRIENGKYEAYGRKLEIERGRLLFAGGPVDNPGIDARAVRRVDDITAGIAIGGTLKSPQLSLFSEPSLSESDTLSYLLFGRPLESTSGAQGRALASAATALKLAGGERLAERLAARFGIEEVEVKSGSRTEEAALVLGKYLSPRLYINYSIGLFEQVNVLRLRYQLTTHWALQVESGAYAGADFLYSIER